MKDMFDQELAIDDFVVAAHGHKLACYKIIKITPLMVRIVRLNAKSKSAAKGTLRYADELLRVDDRMVTFLLLKQ